MLIACSTLCFMRLSLTDAVKRMRELQFSHIDLAIQETGNHCKPSEVLENPMRVAQRLRAENLPYAAFYFMPDDPCSEKACKQLMAITRLARNLSVATVTTQALIDIDNETKRLQDWTELAQRDGIMLCVETRKGTVTSDPQSALELCRRVPGLGITLDPSHYVCGLDSERNFDCLYKYVRHVRLRDTGLQTDQFQVRVGQGAIEVAKILNGLSKFQYRRTLTVDIQDIPDAAFPVEPELRKLKYLIESLI